MLRNRMLNGMLFVGLLLGLVAFGMARSEPIAGQDDADVEAKIASAMSAGLPTFTENATILDNELDEAGAFVVLREGSNGWFCSPDAPGTPGADPWCYDQAWLDWSYAFVANEAPETANVGFAYMLQGGSDASNTDPFATEPAEGDEWIATPPHTMLLMPEPIDQTVYATDQQAGGPWIMWAGTPYEHIMMPVAEAETAE